MANTLYEMEQEAMGGGGAPVEISPQATVSGVLTPEQVQSKISSIYGSEPSKIAGDVGSVMSSLRGNMDKNVANADYYNQQAGREAGIANAKAGLSGVDTSAASEQSRRNAIYGAAGINEAAKRDATDKLGKASMNIASGVNKIEQQNEANRLAAMGTPVPADNSSSGLFGLGVFGL